MSASQAASKEQRLEAEREQKDDECLEAAKRRWRVANNTAAVDAALEAWRASKDAVAAKLAEPEDKKRLRRERDERIKEAKEARCQCPSTCVLEGVSYRRLRRGSSASTR